MRVAREYRLPPSKYLGLPVRKWGETDYLLTMALDLHDRLTCRECGQWAQQCRDDQLSGRWQVHVSTCYPSAAIEDFRAEHGDDLAPGTILAATLLPEGEKPRDPLAFDAARAKAEYEEHQRRFGLPLPDGLDDPRQ